MFEFCGIRLKLKYSEIDETSEYSVESVSGYEFELNDEYYQSTNAGKQSSYSLCKIVFRSSTGKLYLDCVGGGEANYDFGIISNIDMTLTESYNADSGDNVKKSFKGNSSYTETVEFDVDDNDDHFIYVKYRKDSSSDVSPDCLKFKVRFEEE